MPKYSASKLLHGGDYNPDQWLDHPAVIAEDFDLFPQANFNVVSLGIFAWSQLEREEGQYTFEWLDDIFARCAKAGISVFLSTPSGAPPAWMTHRYPEIMRMEPSRVRRLPGARVKWCITSPVYREKVREMNQRLAKRYGKHPSLALWHISNEYIGECHCPLCQGAFRLWLQQEYGSLDALNNAWWTTFWSHAFTDWEQISSPAPHGETESLHGLALAWKRFTTHQYATFLRNEIDAVRAFSPHVPTSTNFHPGGTHLDYRVLAREIDVISWDAYPTYHDKSKAWQEGGWNEPVAFSFTHDIYRSMKEGNPFLLIETTPSSCNWMGTPKLKRPGVARFTAMQAVAHGSDSVLYFQWRAGRGGEEKFHGAVIEHGGGPGNRVFREVADTGRMLADLQPVVGSVPQHEVAICFDWDNRWALGDVIARGSRSRNHYPWEQLDIYRVYWEAGISVTFPALTDDSLDLNRYPLLIAPMQYILQPGVAERLTAYVEAGGVLVTGYFSGTADRDDLVFPGGMHAAWRKLIGLRREETDFIYDDEHNRFVFNGPNDLGLSGSYQARVALELCHPETAHVLATYGDDFYAGMPALTVNTVGKGQVYYQCARADHRFLNDLHRALVKQLGIKPNLPGVELPQGVTVQRRVGTDGRQFLFFINAERQTKELNLGTWHGRDLQSGHPLRGQLQLGAYGCVVAETLS